MKIAGHCPTGPSDIQRWSVTAMFSTNNFGAIELLDVTARLDCGAARGARKDGMRE
jgi:hypothetical protein